DRLGGEEDRPVFAALDEDGARAAGEDAARGACDVALAGEEPRLLVVHHQQVDARQQRLERLAGAFDPVVHRVAGDQRGPLELREHALLEGRIDVREEYVRRAADGRGNSRAKIGEHVQLERQRVADVQVLVIAAAPRTAGGMAARSVMIAWRNASGQGQPVRAGSAAATRTIVRRARSTFACSTRSTSSIWTSACAVFQQS